MNTIKNYTNAFIHRISIAFYKLRLVAQKTFKLTKQYQPDPFNSFGSEGIRECISRYETIDKALPKEPLSVIDIGCNEGYFVFKLAQRGGFCMGVDSGRNEIMLAESYKHTKGVQNVVFSNMELVPDSFEGMPKFDVVIFLSVYHHIARHNGVEYALDFMRGISKINKRYLIFETGQPDESGVGWTKDMDFMKPDVVTYINNLLRSVGYTKVSVIGKNKAIRSNAQRVLFLAEK